MRKLIASLVERLIANSPAQPEITRIERGPFIAYREKDSRFVIQHRHDEQPVRRAASSREAVQIISAAGQGRLR